MTFEDFKWTVYDRLAKELENSMNDNAKLLFGYDNLFTVQCDEFGIVLEFLVEGFTQKFKVFIANDCLAKWQKHTDYENAYNDLYNGNNPYTKLKNNEDKIQWEGIVGLLNDIIKKRFLFLLAKGWKC